MDDPFFLDFISFPGVGDSFAIFHVEDVAIMGDRPASTTAADTNGSRMILSYWLSGLPEWFGRQGLLVEPGVPDEDLSGGSPCGRMLFHRWHPQICYSDRVGLPIFQLLTSQAVLTLARISYMAQPFTGL